MAPFSAKVGAEVHIVARNEVAGGCELDEIWLHCIEGRGSKVKLTDRIAPALAGATPIELASFSTRLFASRTGRAENQRRRFSQRVLTRRYMAANPSKYDVPTRYEATTSVNQ